MLVNPIHQLKLCDFGSAKKLFIGLHFLYCKHEKAELMSLIYGAASELIAITDSLGPRLRLYLLSVQEFMSCTTQGFTTDMKQCKLGDLFANKSARLILSSNSSFNSAIKTGKDKYGFSAVGMKRAKSTSDSSSGRQTERNLAVWCQSLLSFPYNLMSLKVSGIVDGQVSPEYLYG